MKYLKTIMVICALVTLLSTIATAQNDAGIKINGSVFGPNKLPVKGAVVSSTNEADNEVTTDASGRFTINVPLNAPLAVTAKGFSIKHLSANNNLKEIELEVENNIESVQVAFRKLAKQDLPGGVSSVDVPNLLTKNYFTYPLDGMEGLVPGYNGNGNRGMDSYLLLVDGIPRDVGSVTPTEIGQIVFLKDGPSVALYGSRAAKGVINIITKRGETKDRRVSLRVNSGINTPKAFPKYLGSAEYMTLYNEARHNDGLANTYSQQDIYNYSTGKKQYRYPNVDFYSSDYLKNAYGTKDATAEISGGNERARFYTNIGYTSTGSLLNFGAAKKYNNSDRLNFRGNIDVNLNEYLTLNVDATAIFYTGRGINADYWGSAATVRPNRFTPLIPLNMIETGDSLSQVLVKNNNNIIDGKYLLGGTQLDQSNPIATVYAGGNNNYYSRQFQFSTGIKADLRNILKGLSFKTNFAIDYSTTYSLAYNYTYATYQPLWNNYSGTDLISSLSVYGQDSKSGTQNVSGNWYRQTLALSSQINYERTLKNKHNVLVTALVNGFLQSTSGIYHNTANSNLGFLASYNFDHKYYFDFSTAYIHSAKLPPNNRNAFSPAVTLGWRVSQENFLKNSKVVDDLKLTASASILHTDLDISDYYLYQGYYTNAGAWYGWKDGVGITETESRRGDNPNLVFPKREELSVGFEGTFFKKLLNVNSSFFVNKISGNLIQASVLFPTYFTTYWPVSSFIPYVNYNADKRVGFEFGATLHKKVGGVNLSMGLNATYYTTKADKRAEVYQDSYQYRQSKSIDAIWGLQSLGFFKDQNDIANSPKPSFGQVSPGDIKYKDQNGDGIIDSKDEVKLGKGGWYGAPLTMGLNLTAQWKKLTIFALGTGRFGASAFKNNSYFWVYGEGKYSAVVRDRWTDATQNTAKYPRLTTLNSDNNFRASDFWIYSTNRFDLSKVQVSYDLTGMLKKKAFLRELGVYISGFNLLTISQQRQILELNIGSAPQTRMYNLGIKALF